jgi:hypothetical protein
MRKRLTFASIIFLGMGTLADRATAQTLTSYLPNIPLTSGVPANAFLGQYLFPSSARPLVPDLMASSCYFHLDMQSDGNLVTYAGAAHNSVWWASGTNYTNQYCGPGVPCFYATLQPDGNFVIQNALAQQPVWASNTQGQVDDYLVQQNDGNLVLYSQNNGILWSSNRGGAVHAGSCRNGNGVWTAVDGYLNTGHVMKTVWLAGSGTGSDYASCGIVCNGTPNCVAFNWFNYSANCTLLSSNGALEVEPIVQTGWLGGS